MMQPPANLEEIEEWLYEGLDLDLDDQHSAYIMRAKRGYGNDRVGYGPATKQSLIKIKDDHPIRSTECFECAHTPSDRDMQAIWSVHVEYIWKYTPGYHECEIDMTLPTRDYSIAASRPHP
jgi:hypothetical protein